MSVIVKGMEMPKNCEECMAYVCYRTWSGDPGDCFCGLTKRDVLNSKKINGWCPLIEIPKDAKLVDANELLDKSEWYGERATYDNPMPNGEEAIPVECINEAVIINTERNRKDDTE